MPENHSNPLGILFYMKKLTQSEVLFKLQSMKSKLCKKLGIKLLHIREDLWLRDKNQMKQIILKFLQK